MKILKAACPIRPLRNYGSGYHLVRYNQSLHAVWEPFSAAASGDTLRVSLTANPVEEVKVAWAVLSAMDLRRRGPLFISCPTCGRTEIDLERITAEVEERLQDFPLPISIAIMGCVVNGPEKPAMPRSASPVVRELDWCSAAEKWYGELPRASWLMPLCMKLNCILKNACDGGAKNDVNVTALCTHSQGDAFRS